MKNAFFNLCRWVLFGLAACFAVGNLMAANSVTKSWSGEVSGNAWSYTATLTITSVVNVSGTTYDLGYTWAGTASGSLAHNTFAAVSGYGIVGSQITNSRKTVNESGTIRVNATSVTVGGVPRHKFDLSVGTQYSDSGGLVTVVYYTDEPICGDVSFNYYLPGTDIGGTEYHVVADGDASVDEVLFDGVVGYGAVHHLEGTIASFCGTIRTEKRKANMYPDGVGWAPYTPLSGPPGGLPDAPDGPSPLPSGPDVPEPPDTGTDPTPPDPLSPPPSGGSGGDAELIEWAKDTNGVARGISDRADVSNEYLRQIRDKASYMADRLKTIDENTQTLADDVKRKADAEEAINDAKPTTAEMASAGQLAASGVVEALGVLPSSNISANMTAPVFVVLDPFTGKSFNLNPFTEDRLGPVAQWLRKLALWLIVVTFAGWAALRGRETITEIASAQQAKGNAVFAGTGGQATALIAAGLITAVVLAGVIGVVVWKDIVLQGAGGSVTAVMGLNPMESAPAACVWMIDQVIPVLTILAIVFAKVTFTFTCTVAYVVAASVIRFIVP